MLIRARYRNFPLDGDQFSILRIVEKSNPPNARKIPLPIRVFFARTRTSIVDQFVYEEQKIRGLDP